MNLTPELELYARSWKNEDDYNTGIHAMFTEIVNSDPVLKAHRDFVEQEQWGFGDRAFHQLWKLLVDQMPPTFDFLEIGVYKGQVLSLVALLAGLAGKVANITGVTTLTNTRDERCQYVPGDYLAFIHGIYQRFKVSFDRTQLVVGKSNDQHVLAKIGGMDFDAIYLDGSHDYEIVKQDLDNYGKRVRVGGFFIIDDASIGRLKVGTCWSGLEDVARAVTEILDPNPSFRFLFALGHVNLYQKVK